MSTKPVGRSLFRYSFKVASLIVCHIRTLSVSFQSNRSYSFESKTMFTENEARNGYCEQSSDPSQPERQKNCSSGPVTVESPGATSAPAPKPP